MESGVEARKNSVLLSFAEHLCFRKACLADLGVEFTAAAVAPF